MKVKGEGASFINFPLGVRPSVRLQCVFVFLKKKAPVRLQMRLAADPATSGGIDSSPSPGQAPLSRAGPRGRFWVRGSACPRTISRSRENLFIQPEGAPRKWNYARRGCAVVPGWRVGGGTRGGTSTMPRERNKIKERGLRGSTTGLRERIKRSRSCATPSVYDFDFGAGSTIASVALQGRTLALARVQHVLYIPRRMAARPDQEGPMHIGVVCIPQMLPRVGEHMQPAQEK